MDDVFIAYVSNINLSVMSFGHRVGVVFSMYTLKQLINIGSVTRFLGLLKSKQRFLKIPLLKQSSCVGTVRS